MDFGLSTEQNMLKRSAREFLAAECQFEFVRAMATDERGCPPEFWRKLSDMGWTALPFPEQYGGAGGSIVDLAVLLEEMGRVNMPGPFFSSVVLGGTAVLEGGTEQQKKDLLPAIAEGQAIASLALLEPSLSYDPASIEMVAKATSSGYSLSGSKLFVPDAHLADYVVCTARTGDAGPEDIGLFLIRKPAEASGVGVSRLSTMAGDKQFELVLRDMAVAGDDVLADPGAAWPAVERVLRVAVVAQCAQVIGASQRVLDLCVEQGHNRVQFGRPVGSFQAIQHHCANMIMDVDLGRFLTYQAAWLISEGRPCVKEVSLAKSFVGDAYLRVSRLGHEVLGGGGIIEEHEMPLFSKRVPAMQELFGSPDYHRELAVQALGV